MAETESESQAQQTKRHEEQKNDDLGGEEDELGDGKEEEEVEEEGVRRVSESQGAVAAQSSDAELKGSQLETLRNGDRCEGKF